MITLNLYHDDIFVDSLTVHDDTQTIELKNGDTLLLTNSNGEDIFSERNGDDLYLFFEQSGENTAEKTVIVQHYFTNTQPPKIYINTNGQHYAFDSAIENWTIQNTLPKHLLSSTLSEAGGVGGAVGFTPFLIAGGLTAGAIALTKGGQKDVDNNHAPSDITLSNTRVDEHIAGVEIGRLNTIDPDKDDSHTYSVNDARFEVKKDILKLKTSAIFDHATEPTVNVEVTSTDKGKLSHKKTFTIEVQNIDAVDVAPAARSIRTSNDPTSIHDTEHEEIADASKKSETIHDDKTDIHLDNDKSIATETTINDDRTNTKSHLVDRDEVDADNLVVHNEAQEANDASNFAQDNHHDPFFLDAETLDGSVVKNNMNVSETLIHIDDDSATHTLGIARDGLDIDLTQISNVAAHSHLENIDIIDLREHGDNTLSLTNHDVLNIAGTNHFDVKPDTYHQLMVRGDEGDQVKVDHADQWQQNSDTFNYDGVHYTVYTHSSSAAQLLLEEGITLVPMI